MPTPFPLALRPASRRARPAPTLCVCRKAGDISARRQLGNHSDYGCPGAGKHFTLALCKREDAATYRCLCSYKNRPTGRPGQSARYGSRFAGCSFRVSHLHQQGGGTQRYWILADQRQLLFEPATAPVKTAFPRAGKDLIGKQFQNSNFQILALGGAYPDQVPRARCSDLCGCTGTVSALTMALVRYRYAFSISLAFLDHRPHRGGEFSSGPACGFNYLGRSTGVQSQDLVVLLHPSPPAGFPACHACPGQPVWQLPVAL